MDRKHEQDEACLDCPGSLICGFGEPEFFTCHYCSTLYVYMSVGAAAGGKVIPIVVPYARLCQNRRGYPSAGPSYWSCPMCNHGLSLAR